GISFVESSFFPIPPDILLIPMVLADRGRAFLIAGVCTLSSVAGGFLGYAIGYFLFEAIGQPIIGFYGLEAAFASFKDSYVEYGAIIVFVFGLTPLPYKVITIASGVAALNPVVFGLASVASRGLRFSLEAALLYWLGPAVREFIEKRLEIATVAVVVVGLAGFVAVKYLI
ncbi:MAG: YqaA family protein, partial [Alphaproteobacteria bacterium]